MVSSASRRSPATINEFSDGADRTGRWRDRLASWLVQRQLRWVLVGSLVLWAAFPPLGFAPAAWLGMAIWIAACLRPAEPPRGDYTIWYAAGVIHWLLVIHWLRLPHWSAWFGWIALALYLALYLPIFVWLLRSAVTLRISALISAPVIWTGLEWLRSHLFTGLSISLIGHTQVQLPSLIQIADIAGAYTVSFLVVLTASGFALCLISWLPNRKTKGDELPISWVGRSWPTLAALIALICAYGYGQLRISQIQANANKSTSDSVRVALIQGSIDTTFSEADESQLIFEQYASLTREALDQAAAPHQRRLAMIVWPESMFPFPWIDVTQPVQVPTDAVQDGATYRANVDQWRTGTIDQAAGYFGKLAVPAVVGAARLQFGPHPLQRYNSALYFNAQGKLVQSYDKMRPILFGEYLPFGKIFPWLYRLTPMAVGLDRGDTPVVFECEGVRFSPSICFENTIPHLLLTQFRALRARGQSPDVLLTLTNDGWFWGSSLLDTHLACGIFRAVELRRPVLIAANTGFSAWIDATGHVVRRGPRRDRGIVVADVQPHGGGESVYLLVGDFPAAACGMFCGILVLFRLRRWRK